MDQDTLNQALLQHCFTSGEHEVKIAPHGNLRSGIAYTRTMPSIMTKLKEAATPGDSSNADVQTDVDLFSSSIVSSPQKVDAHSNKEWVTACKYWNTASEFLQCSNSWTTTTCQIYI